MIVFWNQSVTLPILYSDISRLKIEVSNLHHENSAEFLIRMAIPASTNASATLQLVNNKENNSKLKQMTVLLVFQITSSSQTFPN